MDRRGWGCRSTKAGRKSLTPGGSRASPSPIREKGTGMREPSRSELRLAEPQGARSARSKDCGLPARARALIPTLRQAQREGAAFARRGLPRVKREADNDGVSASRRRRSAGRIRFGPSDCSMMWKVERRQRRSPRKI